MPVTPTSKALRTQVTLPGRLKLEEFFEHVRLMRQAFVDIQSGIRALEIEYEVLNPEHDLLAQPTVLFRLVDTASDSERHDVAEVCRSSQGIALAIELLDGLDIFYQHFYELSKEGDYVIFVTGNDQLGSNEPVGNAYLYIREGSRSEESNHDVLVAMIELLDQTAMA